MRIKRLGYALGAEIGGVDLCTELDDATIDAIRDAFAEHLMLRFPAQNLSPKTLTAFARRFGELDDNRRTPQRTDPDYPPVKVFNSAPEQVDGKIVPGLRNDIWHTDLSFHVRPTPISFLNARQLPDVGGDTMFANMYAAYDTLSGSMQRLAESLSAVHDATLAANFDRETPEVQAAKRNSNPPVVHPVVRVHPASGRKALNVGQRIRGFAGMSAEESQPILDFLNYHATRYELIYRHRWEPYDFLMWDNFAAMHYAIIDHDLGQTRRMMRCSLLGPKIGQYAR